MLLLLAHFGKGRRARDFHPEAESGNSRGDDGGIRALRLPVSILVGWPHLLRRKANPVQGTP